MVSYCTGCHCVAADSVCKSYPQLRLFFFSSPRGQRKACGRQLRNVHGYLTRKEKIKLKKKDIKFKKKHFSAFM